MYVGGDSVTSIFTQVSRVEGRIERVRPGETPIVELRLWQGQYIAGFELEREFDTSRTRKTYDWRWTAYIVTPLP